MGIPFFFKSLLNKYKTCFFRKVDEQFKTNCSRLFLDYNCILHNAANTVMKNEKIYSLSSNEIEDLVIETSLIDTIHIIKKCNPKDLLYIAVDGLCPLSKIIQQRQRRFMSVWKNNLLAEYKEHWDRNNITPGTFFMKKFNLCIKSFADNLKVNFKVIISDSDEFGEGEHKIIEFIQNQARNNDRTIGETDIIYGLDADLILLSMTCTNNIILLRENSILYIDKLKHCLLEFHDMFENKGFIQDFIFICSLLGNDFLPNISYLKLKEDGITFLINEYKKIYNKYNSNIITPEGIDTHILHALINSLSVQEDELLGTIIKKYENQTIVFNDKNMNNRDKVLFQINNYPIINKNMYNLNENNWKEKYYYSLFNKKTGYEFIQDVCKSYIRGLNFIYGYYFKRAPIDYTFYYPYLYSPTLRDLSNYFDVINQDHNIVSKDEYIHLMGPKTQLMIVLPLTSLVRIDNIMYKFIMNLENECRHFYPDEFKISTFLKQYIWECYPVLPNINIHILSNASKMYNLL